MARRTRRTGRGRFARICPADPRGDQRWVGAPVPTSRPVHGHHHACGDLDVGRAAELPELLRGTPGGRRPDWRGARHGLIHSDRCNTRRPEACLTGGAQGRATVLSDPFLSVRNGSIQVESRSRSRRWTGSPGWSDCRRRQAWRGSGWAGCTWLVKDDAGRGVAPPSPSWRPSSLLPQRSAGGGGPTGPPPLRPR